MSLETWKKEFYPFDADEFAGGDFSVVEALEHSIDKWIGLRRNNLKKHKLEHGHRFNRREIYDPVNDVTFSISTDSCSLCVLYYDNLNNCLECPLSQMLGNPCDNGSDEEMNRPYSYWLATKDPEPMIEALERTLVKRIQELGF